MKKLIGAFIGAFFLAAGIANAHVVVKPNQANIGAFQAFTVGVPVEKDIPTVGLRLVIPEGLQYVTPNVKPGWKVTVKKSGTGEEATVTEISWTAGSIPVGERDDFGFSAKVPATETTLQWKAYQTYRDGTVVSWDMAPGSAMDDDKGMGPYSETKIIDDLKPTPKKFDWDLLVSIVALGLGGVALARTMKKR